MVLSSNWLGHNPLKVEIRVRVPVALQKKKQIFLLYLYCSLKYIENHRWESL